MSPPTTSLVVELHTENSVRDAALGGKCANLLEGDLVLFLPVLLQGPEFVPMRWRRLSSGIEMESSFIDLSGGDQALLQQSGSDQSG
jgi:hypothetical protein